MKIKIVSLLVIFAASMIYTKPAGTEENPCPPNSYSGYLWGTGAESTFEVYVDKTEMVLTFDWALGSSDFWVKATGEDNETVLIEQSLSEGNVLTLSGGGIYHIKIYSVWGGGCWEANLVEKTEENDD
jgi:hypothetical protein